MKEIPLWIWPLLSTIFLIWWALAKEENPEHVEHDNAVTKKNVAGALTVSGMIWILYIVTI